jgi:hypothetical protein
MAAPPGRIRHLKCGREPNGRTAGCQAAYVILVMTHEPGELAERDVADVDHQPAGLVSV